MKVVNIVSTYNEKENIGPMLKILIRIAKNNPKYTFFHLIVDDNSPDKTADIVKQWMKKNKSIHLLTGPKKGLGNALLRGYKYAIKKLKADVIIPNDCDFSWNPSKITKLLTKIDQGYDVVVASRYGNGSQIKGWSLFRKINHYVANFVFSTLIAGIKEVKDHNANFKAIKVKGVLDKVPIKEILKKTKVRGFAFQPYIIYELSKVTTKFCEIPVVFKYRLKGETKISKKYFKTYIKDVIEYMKLCFVIRFKRLWEKGLLKR